MSSLHKRHRIFWVSKWLVAFQEEFFAQWSYLYQELNFYFNIRKERLLIYIRTCTIATADVTYSNIV